MNKIYPLISVVIPAYNAELFLDETLESVLSQTYENWECIIVNDGSTDSTESVAKKWCEKDSRFRLTNKENGGLSSARNWGIKESKAEYIAFLDADDILTPDSLEVRINTLLKENVDLVYSNAYRINYREYTKQLLRCIHIGRVKDISIFLEINQATPSTVLCRKKIIAIIEDLKLMLINSKVNYSKYLKLWVRRYILLKNEQGKIEKNIKERIKYVNNITPNYFPQYLIYLPLGEKITKLIAIQVMNRKIKEI